MKTLRNHPRQTKLILALFLAAGSTAAWAWLTQPAPTHLQLETRNSKLGPSAHVTYRDPFTGRLGARPEEVAPLVLDNFRAFSTSSEGLVAAESPVLPKTTLLHLRGRFQHGMVLRRDPDNRLTTRCATDLDQPLASHSH